MILVYIYRYIVYIDHHHKNDTQQNNNNNNDMTYILFYKTLTEAHNNKIIYICMDGESVRGRERENKTQNRLFLLHSICWHGIRNISYRIYVYI